jgi:DNA-binding response OmpR family regulator
MKKKKKTFDHVLILEDNTLLLDICLKVFRQAGYSASGYGRIEPFLEDYKTSGMDLFVCDISLPGRDGTELVKTIASSGFFRTVPILFLSGNRRGRQIIELCENKNDFLAIDYIEKPPHFPWMKYRMSLLLKMREYSLCSKRGLRLT